MKYLSPEIQQMASRFLNRGVISILKTNNLVAWDKDGIFIVLSAHHEFVAYAFKTVGMGMKKRAERYVYRLNTMHDLNLETSGKGAFVKFLYGRQQKNKARVLKVKTQFRQHRAGLTYRNFWIHEDMRIFGRISSHTLNSTQSNATTYNVRIQTKGKAQDN